MHRIKIKRRAIFYGMNKRFCGWIYHFSIICTLAELQRQKDYRILAVLSIKMSAPLLPWGLASTPWAMSLYFKFRAIYFWLLNVLMMRSGQKISHYTTAKLSVHMSNHDLIWWQNKIDTQKHFHKTTITSSKTLRKTNISVTIVKAQMSLNPNQKSRAAGR